MNGVNPTINYRLVSADQAPRRAHAERMRMVSVAKVSGEHHAGPAHSRSLAFPQRLAVAAATVVIAVSAAAATVFATGAGTTAGPASGELPNECVAIGYGSHRPC